MCVCCVWLHVCFMMIFSNTNGANDLNERIHIHYASDLRSTIYDQIKSDLNVSLLSYLILRWAGLGWAVRLIR